MSTVRTETGDLNVCDGSIYLDDGSLLVTEISGTVGRLDTDGVLSRIGCGGGLNGGAVGPDGAVYLSNNGGVLLGTGEDGLTMITGGAPGNELGDKGSLQRLDLKTGEVQSLYTHVDGIHIGWMNDIVFDISGNFYAVDTIARQGLLRRPARGVHSGRGDRPRYAERRRTLARRCQPLRERDPRRRSGMERGRSRHSYGPAGLLPWPEQHGWDGLAVDGAGNVCVSNLVGSGISVLSPDGRQLDRFVTPEYDRWVTNISFGGPDLDTAYVCLAGRGILYSVQWPWGGLQLNFAA